jgi:hypothetical protein
MSKPFDVDGAACGVNFTNARPATLGFCRPNHELAVRNKDHAHGQMADRFFYSIYFRQTTP